LPSNSVGLLVSSLGDPYNVRQFWIEVNRVLQPGGAALFTTPSYEWARAFRGADEDALSVAEFELASGDRVYLPSFILSEGEQVRLMEVSGLCVREVTQVAMSALDSQHLSPKLLLGRGPDASILTGFIAQKPYRHAAPPLNR
jgi:hypothetical protein